MKKKLYCIILSLAMVVTMMPMATMTAFAGETKTANSWEGLQAAIDEAQSGDTIKLGADIFAADGYESIMINKKLTLDLNGYMLNAGYPDDIAVPCAEVWDPSGLVNAIYLDEGADLTIKDSRPENGTHTIWYDCALGYWATFKLDSYDESDESNRTQTITGGLITGGSGGYDYESGGGIHVSQGAKCTLESGTIAGNTAYGYGGGVYVESDAQFIMNGGSISCNESNWGGGVFLEAADIEDEGDGKAPLFILNDGSISNNHATNYGGGVYVGSSGFDHSDIGYYEAPYLLITGGSIAKNESDGSGGGVYLSGEEASFWYGDQHTMMAMTGGSITENICYSMDDGYGGAGVCLDSEESCYVYLGGNAVISGNTNPNMEGDNKDNNLLMMAEGYLAFSDTIHNIAAPGPGMNVGVTLANGKGNLTAALDSVPTGISGYLYSDDLEYMVSTDSNKVILTDNIYPILYVNDGTDAHWGCEFGDNNVPKTNPTRENYVFDGWYTAKTGGTLVHDGTEFKNSYTSFAAKTSYYAHWKDTPKTPTVYQMSATAPEYVLTGTPTAVDAASFTISPKEIKEKGYSHVRVKVDVTKPEGSNPIIYRTSDSGKTNIADGFIGELSGFAIAKDYNQTTALTMQFDKPGKYTITFSLIDLDNQNDVLCKAETSVTAQEHSTYKFDINEPDTWITGEEYSTGDVTLKYDKNNGLGYDKVCVKVEQTEKPDDSNAIIYDSTDNTKTNLLTSGYLGSSEGFELDKDYNNKTPLTMKFDKAGTYTFKFTLVDKNDSDKVLCSATKTIVVSPKLECKVNITGTQAQSYQLTVEVTDLPTGVDVTYKWYRCKNAEDPGTEISGATSNKHNLSDKDIGAIIKVRVFAAADSGYGGYVEATTSGAIKKTFASKPTITVGKNNEYAPRTGEAIQASIANTGELNYDNVTFQWYRCDTADSDGTAIDGATTKSYTPTEEDLGKYIKVKITAKNTSECGGSIMSNATAKVKNPPSITDPAIVTDTSIKLPTNGSPNKFEYSTDGKEWNGTYEFTGLKPATEYTYYIREKVTAPDLPTAGTVVKVYTAFATPQKDEGYTINYKAQKVTIATGYEISTMSDKVGGNFDEGKLTPDESGNVSIIPGENYYVRKAAVTDGAPASAALYLTEIVLPNAPDSAPAFNKKTANTISVIAIPGQEYSINGGKTWVTDNGKGDADTTTGIIKFSGLLPGTTYNIITRKAEVTTPGSEAFAGKYSEMLTVTTDASFGPSPSPATVDSDDDKVIVSGDTVAVDVSDKTNALLTVEKLNELVENEAIEQLVVKTEDAQFTFDKEAITEIAKQSSGSTLVEIAAIWQEEESKEASHDVYELKVVAISGDSFFIIGDFNDGDVTVRVDIPKGLVGKKLGCLYKDDEGVYSRVTIINQNNEQGFFEFTTKHFSSYVVAEAPVATKMLVNQTSVTQNKLKSTTTKQVKVSFKKATWDKELGKKVVRYQVYRSTKANKGFKRIATLKNQKKSTITYTNKKYLKSGKKYYYKVRGMVKLANGKYVYTKWSKVRSIKVK